MMGVNRYFRGIWDPPIEFYRAIPPLAYIPLTVLWFGIEDFQKILVIFLAVFAPLVINTKAGVLSLLSKFTQPIAWEQQNFKY